MTSRTTLFRTLNLCPSLTLFADALSSAHTSVEVEFDWSFRRHLGRTGRTREL